MSERETFLLWRHMSGGAIFSFSFEKCLWRQPYCLLDSGLVRQKPVRSGLVRNGLFFVIFLLERSSDLSNSGEFKRQTATEIAI